MKKVPFAAAVFALLAVGVLTFVLPGNAVRTLPTNVGAGATAAATTAGAAAAGRAAADDPHDDVARRTPVANEASHWRLVGSVRDPAPTAASPARVRVEATFGGDDDDDLLLHDAPCGTGGAGGAFAVALDALRELPPLDLARVSLRVTVIADERLPERATVELPHRDVERSLVVTHDVELPDRQPLWTGRVVGATGGPVGGACVTYTPAATGKDWAATTDLDGRYWLVPTPEQAVTISATHIGFGVGELRCAADGRASRTVPDLVLHDTTVLRARLVFASGLPVPGLDVSLHDVASEGSPGLGGIRTDADGRIVVHALPPGSYRVRAEGIVDAGWPALTTNEPEATLVVSEHHLVRLSFEDERGRALRPLSACLRICRGEHAECVAAFAAGGPCRQGSRTARPSPAASTRCSCRAVRGAGSPRATASTSAKRSSRRYRRAT